MPAAVKRGTNLNTLDKHVRKLNIELPKREEDLTSGQRYMVDARHKLDLDLAEKHMPSHVSVSLLVCAFDCSPPCMRVALLAPCAYS